ncbi:AraC family transcriptional regulator [Caproicibacter fermentans]|uniref:GyrI-like domain-containing protein n=1 Tax=Caproicibacter fermentans TaxID=2576756 RepID=A0A7G8TAV6_9FIRM|nr:GyrI-like domain-containing protein [Caproicibacter fermentans]QNK40747.1 GyrI-like domain-containing protein [Caproicibacter fermentans]
MRIHLEKIPAHPVVYLRRIGAYGEQNVKLMQDMKEWIRHQELWNDFSTIYGIAQDNPATTPSEQCRYDVCLETDKTFEDQAVQSGALPAGTYLVFEIPHTTENVQCFGASLADVLLKEGKHIDKSRPVLERYKVALVNKGFCEFCVPVSD